MIINICHIKHSMLRRESQIQVCIIISAIKMSIHEVLTIGIHLVPLTDNIRKSYGNLVLHQRIRFCDFSFTPSTSFTLRTNIHPSTMSNTISCFLFAFSCFETFYQKMGAPPRPASPPDSTLSNPCLQEQQLINTP